ncbi:glycine zipper 2TM domain-containing protein [Novosphingobium sp. Leaf2]|uniref:glycine zipper 2TM domain-containing protein n=1 Tax=Novosphingobium sp. Leaf2 TaxID=1735670 RepID=UPI000700FBED|nr:glycine zipper 2TM domain-containing protein [Novosphingobium sp. Leaf2]KQM21845.1 hypothetical protein ASE49_00550 [Novosphingobium sp. Leaf2]
MRISILAASISIAVLPAIPAFAQAGYDAPAGHYADRYEGDRQYRREDYDHAREGWLADCRRRISSRDSGVGGAMIGGVAGGVIGNRIAGRGNRTLGTVAGGLAGAAAGVAIDKAEDRGRARDECEAYLDDYYAGYQRGPAGYDAPYGYGQAYPGYGYPVMAVPMMMVPAPQSRPPCTETVEYVYEDVPVRPARRVIPRRAKVVPDKRVRLAPDKRVPIK